ncbi:hypothetical protein PpBr36_01489 [Pyricularia pennisetigena]|uniref:hypothetical protein n=1 Tax=Pyricularia pennisetigena TaxID=1578925 RepID=UPI00115256EE|nr:hypothetical protein PpBr36_01489 [Pyricularia pennisetigena]TLS29408.1 hypothetical protein PpBr36_01489 [Pyricularia pennisetigena]
MPAEMRSSGAAAEEELQRQRSIEQAIAEGHDADMPSNTGFVVDEKANQPRKQSRTSPYDHPPAKSAADIPGHKPEVDPESAVDVTGTESDGKISRVANSSEVDPNVVWWDSDDDPENPYNWPGWKKWLNCGFISFLTLLTPLASSMFAPGVPELLQEFKITNTELGSFVVSIYVLGYAFGPLVIAPLSEIYGRSIVYHVCNVGFVAFVIACAVAPTIESLIAFRFISGLFGSCPITNGGGSIADMIPQEKRGLALSVFTLGPLLGPVIGPVAGGFLSAAKGWRWNFWVIAIAAGFTTICMMLFLNETYARVILDRKVAKLRKETGNELLRSKLDAGLSAKDYFARSIVRPLKMLLFSPITQIFAIYVAIVYGYLYLLFTTITSVFIQTYGFTPSTAGLSFLGLGIGSLVAQIVFTWTSDAYVQRRAEREGNGMKPEYRLLWLPFGAAVLPIGFFIYGWTVEYKVHWIAPILGMGVVGVATILLFMSMTMYLIDSFTMYAASALAANTLIRSIAGAVLPLAAPKMYAKLGLGWGNSLLAFIALAMVPVPFVFQRYGEYLRTRFKVNLEYDLDDMSPRAEPVTTPLRDQNPTPHADNLISSPPPPDTPPKDSKTQVVFNGPPPPIFSARPRNSQTADAQSAAAAATSALYGLGSALFSRRGSGAGSVSSKTHDNTPRLEQDTVWQSFQRRERALQRDAQRLLDLQASGLSAGLGHASSSDHGTHPRSSGSSSPAASRGRGGTASQSRLSILDPPTQADDHGQVVPVRQPRSKPVGLRGARAGLGRTLTLLADLRAEEDACLASALGQRKSALVKVRKMNTRREGLLDELRALESDEEEPLARELRDLQDEHGAVCRQIEDLEEKLALLKSRQRRMEDDMSTLVNRREAGLSGYRGALKEVDAKLADVLSRPPVKPLDVSVFKESARGVSPCGLEFLSLNPERRTASMAMEWWDKEVLILERRKKAVDKERVALEEGAEVWAAVTKLITAFESELRGSITAGEDGSDETSQEDKLRMQLVKMETVINGLEDHLQHVEQEGWNLLICAIGAELEAFREAYLVLRSAMADLGIEVDDDATPRLARSTTDPKAAEAEGSFNDKGKQKEPDDRGSLLDLRAQDAEEDDNAVPHDLLVDSHHDDERKEIQRPSRREASPSLHGEESDNEIPPEFLREHQD